ncbi:MAG: RNA polymerase sigma factor [Bacteroidales bacterium]|nr:RNA polymerase sigma factor [Bacteroidales bacterium]
MDKKKDEFLMLSVKQGDLDSMAPLFEKYHASVYRYYYRCTQDVELSKDMCQNLFARVLKFRHAFPEGANFRGWLFVIARNLKYDHYRKNKHIINNTIRTDEIKDETVTTAEETESNERTQILYEALKKLKPEYRDIIEMAKFEGLKYEEISKLNGSSVGAVKLRVHRAMNKLREIYFEIA